MLRKPTYLLFSLLISLSVSTASQLSAQEDAPQISISFDDEAEAAAPTEPTVENQRPAIDGIPYSDEEMTILFLGWYTMFQEQMDKIELNDRDKTAFLTGVNLALNGTMINDWQEQLPGMNALMNERAQPFLEKQKAHRAEIADKVFTALETAENVVKTDSGLYYEVISEGTGKFPTSTDVVAVKYQVTLFDGTLIDDTNRKEESGVVTMNLDGTIPGLQEALQKIREAGVMKVWMRSDLAWGEEAIGGIPANSPLFFHIELREILSK